MSLKVGIVGLPNVGKSTLFNALLKKRVALSANYPFATIEPNTGVVAVPDVRLQKLAELTKNEEKMTGLPPIVPAVVEFVDIAGLVKGAATGAGLGNQFLSHIREVDAIVHVLRDFNDSNIIREGSISPDEDMLTIETELGLADLQTLEKLILVQDKQLRISKDVLDAEKLQILHSVQDDLNNGRIIGKYKQSFPFSDEKRHIGDERVSPWFKTLPLISIKPVLYVYNVGEEEYSERVKNVIPANAGIQLKTAHSELDPRLRGDDNTIVICAKIEEELSDLSEGERVQYLAELGIKEPGLDRLIKKAYKLLGLGSFLTAGKKEVRAWTFKIGFKAPQAAGVIHTDFEKKFIRAEVIDYEKLIEAGSHVEAKNKGFMRTEGKEYQVQDGDVIEFLIGA